MSAQSDEAAGRMECGDTASSVGIWVINDSAISVIAINALFGDN